jgi:hypothetical protein
MDKYQSPVFFYILVAFILGICIKLYDDFTDFDNLNIPSIHTDTLKMLIFMLNTIVTLYDYRFSFIPIFAVLASYVADKLKKTFVNDFVHKFLETSITKFKETTLWDKLNTDIKTMIDYKSHIGNYNDYKNAINDNQWNVYMISSIIAILLAIILNPSQLSLQLINLINAITIALCIGFNIVEPYIFPEEDSDAKIYSRLFCSLFIVGIILFGNYIIPFYDINYIISFSVLGYISTSVISMYIYRYKTTDELEKISKT